MRVAFQPKDALMRSSLRRPRCFFVRGGGLIWIAQQRTALRNGPTCPSTEARPRTTNLSGLNVRSHRRNSQANSLHAAPDRLFNRFGASDGQASQPALSVGSSRRSSTVWILSEGRVESCVAHVDVPPVESVQQWRRKTQIRTASRCRRSATRYLSIVMSVHGFYPCLCQSLLAMTRQRGMVDFSDLRRPAYRDEKAKLGLRT
jgi:hypothetical protein